MASLLFPVTGTSNQANLTNNQTFDIDINQFYNEVVSAVDQVRSHVSLVASKNAVLSMLKALSNNQNPYQFINQLITNPSTPQETRCSAFYRLLGLPVIAPNGTLFSPGYDINPETIQNYTTIQQQHINVINAITPDLFTLMDNREINVNSISSIFSLSNQASGLPNINASVLALSSVSGGRVRRFFSSLQSANPFDTAVTNQSYTVGDPGGNVYNSTNTAKLIDYLGPDGQYPIIALAPSKLLNQSPLSRRAHIIKPFITDPRINLTINPPNGMICAPFAIDKSKTRYAQDIYLTRPYIETICRYRCNNHQNQNNQSPGQGASSQRYQDLQDYIQNTNIRNTDLLTKLAQTPATTNTDDILLEYVQIMNSMVTALYGFIGDVQIAEAQVTGHQWVPIPSVQGPEFGMITPDVFLISGPNGAMIDPIITANYPIDQDIVTLTAQIQLESINTQVQDPDLGNFAFQGLQSLPDDKATQSLGSRPQNSLDDAVKVRNASCSKAAIALQNIEIIMGEFSGFGLCDILALYAALWTIDEGYLISMLDDPAFDRMYTDPTLRDEVVTARAVAGVPLYDGLEVITAFEEQVRLMYLLMDKLYDDVSKNNTTGS
jgi:hypothetical protein